MLDQSQIAALIPHSGSMCLLEKVTAWSENSICCITGTHKNQDNPLAVDGKVGVLTGIEYACQAMALHGALTAGVENRPEAGLLVSVRAVHAAAEWLDDIIGDLIVEAQLAMSEGLHVLYHFILRSGEGVLLRGTAVAMLDTGQPAMKPGE